MHAAGHQKGPRGGGILILAAALVTAPLCKLLRWTGERLRDACCEDDEDDEVEHAEADGDGDAEVDGDEDGDGGRNSHGFFQTLTRHIFASG